MFDVLFLLIVYIGAWEFWRAKEETGANYIKNYILASTYYFFWSFLLIRAFPGKVEKLVKDFDLIPLAIFLAFFLFFLLVYKFLPRWFKKPEKLIKAHPNELFLLLDYRFFAAKSFDILFQQTGIVLMAVMLFEMWFSLPAITVFLAILFSVLHLPLLKTKGSAFGAYFALAAMVGAVIFPTLIIQVNYGFVYSYLVHWSFYIFSAVLFWAYGNKL